MNKNDKGNQRNINNKKEDSISPPPTQTFYHN